MKRDGNVPPPDTVHADLVLAFCTDPTADVLEEHYVLWVFSAFKDHPWATEGQAAAGQPTSC